MKADGIGRIESWRQIGASRIGIRGERGIIGVEAVDERIVRIVCRFAGSGDAAGLDWSSTIAVAKNEAAAREIHAAETDHELHITAGEIELAFGKTDGAHRARIRSAPDGLQAVQRVSWEPGGGIVWAGSLSDSSRVFGLGETTGYLDKRGEKYVLWNTDANHPHVPETESLYQSIPWLIHFEDGQAYGVFFDYPGKMTVDLRSQADQYRVFAQTDRLDGYLIFGPSLKETVSGYGKLTGRMELPPMWAIGYHQSRYSYKTKEEALAVARTFREKRIPLDAVYLDIHYMDGFRVFTFDPERFAQPEEMIAELAAMGVHAVPIVDPGVKKDPNFHIYREGVKKGYFVRKLEGELYIGKVWPGDSAFPDFTHPEVRKWWGGLHRFYTEMGIRGIWNDMNEPGIFDTASQTMDPDVILDNDGNPKTHAELHNLYGLQMTRATHDALRSLLGGERPFIVSRAGYAGIQRYACVWTGDNRSYWEHLAMSVPMMLNLGLSGVAFTGADIGGYGHHAGGELIARWTQLGVFSPFCRNHNEIDRADQEPWRFGERIEKICRSYIELRYRWMPHLYNLFREASLTGLPILRPLVLEYPADGRVHRLCDQFLFGADVLAAPVYRPDAEYRSVYLPEGDWYDYWSGGRLSGGRPVLAEAPLEIMPLYVRAGAVLPERKVRQFAADSDGEDGLAFRVYMPGIAATGSVSVYELYEDDGLTEAYKRGEYNLLRLEARFDAKRIVFRCRYVYAGWERTRSRVVIRLAGCEAVPRQIQDLSGQTIEFQYDSSGKALEFVMPVENSMQRDTHEGHPITIIF